jgi:hypothetical protein
MLKRLVKFANKLDRYRLTRDADLVDWAIEKLAVSGVHDDDDEELGPGGEVVSFPGSEDDDFSFPSDEDALKLMSEEELMDEDLGDEGDDVLGYAITFISALYDGAYGSLEEAQQEAKAVLDMHKQEYGMTDPEPSLEPDTGKGQILDFPGV